MSFQAQFTYVVCNNTASGALTANTRKDILSMESAVAGTKNKRILRIEASWLATTALAGDLRFFLYRGTAATSAGTVITAIGKHPADPAAELVAKSNPTITAATLVFTHIIGSVPATANSILARSVLYDWAGNPREDDFVMRALQLDSLVMAITSTAAINWTPFLNVYFVEE